MIRVYRYGLLPPRENADRVRDQMRLAHTYRNRLVEIERGRRAAMREVLTVHGDVAALAAAATAADDTCVVALDAVKRQRAKTRSRSESAEQNAALKAAREAKKAALLLLREARAKLRDDATVIAARDAIEERAAGLRRAARAECAVYWGSYLLVEDADNASRKVPLFDGLLPSDPHFVRWSGEGTVGVQLQKGLSVEDTMAGADRRVRVEAGTAPPGVNQQSKRSARRQYVVLALRVGSEGTEPIWARWEMVMHRPLPAGGVIKWAKVHLRKCGPREVWSVDFTVELAEDRRPAPATNMAVAIDIGWRLRGDDGLRVAMWHAEDGTSGELLLPPRLLSSFVKADDLRSIRDKNFDLARDTLLRHVGAIPSSLPTWLTASITSLAQWRSTARLAGLAKNWKKNRFDGDAEAYDALEAWRYHDFHLWEWETSQIAKTIRHRREIYRLFAAALSRKYTTVVVEEFDLRVFARHSPDPENGTARHSRQVAAVSDLRTILCHAFRNVERVPAQDTTVSCNECGHVNVWNKAAEVTHRCAQCGVTWDQDYNAAVNILARRSSRDDAPPPPAVDAPESRWTRAKRMAGEKKTRNAPAASVAAPSDAE